MELNARKPKVLLSVLISALSLASVALAVANASLWWALDSESCPPSKFEGGTYYGQYYEDYILAYAFAGTTRGTYIDVGANHPIENNVTAYFYARGWRGITIEPNPDFIPMYARLRPEDTNLAIGVGASDGSLTFHRVTERTNADTAGLSTLDDAQARAWALRGYQVVDRKVEIATLDNVLKKHPLGRISFLSIDVEGFEKQVLQGISLKVHKPEVVLLEADAPMTEIPNYLQWEGILLRAGYVFAMFDGLNRYYVHRERLDLLPRFVHVDMCVKMSKLAHRIKLDGWTNF